MNKFRGSVKVQYDWIREKFFKCLIFVHALVASNTPSEFVNFYPQHWTWEWPKSSRNVVYFYLCFLMWFFFIKTVTDKVWNIAEKFKMWSHFFISLFFVGLQLACFNCAHGHTFLLRDPSMDLPSEEKHTGKR